MLPVLRPTHALAPFRPINRLATLFDRLFDEGFPAAASNWSGLPISMWEDENTVHVEADAPGLTDKDIEVSVHNGQLCIRAERKSEGREGGFDTRTYGRFEERVTLPTAVDADKVDAKLANGVLTLAFPKSEEAKPRRIALRSE